MNTNEKKDGMALTLVEAVETLSNIADLEFDREIGIADEHELMLHDRPLAYHTVHWLHQQDSHATVSIVKEIFRVILKYLRGFYGTEYGKIADAKTTERIKTIMVLVGEAAKKLDKYTAMFYKTKAQSVTELKEYRQLQEFYHDRIARKIDEGTLGKWVLALSQKGSVDKPITLQGLKAEHMKHVFIDLDSVKKDTEYELFFIRKEDGTRFFSPRLLRNIKLVSDFGSYVGSQTVTEKPFDVANWHDKTANAFARSILASTKNYVEKFYKVALQNKEREIVEDLNKAVVALKMAANTQNITHRDDLKNCFAYFRDFQMYLRNCVNSVEYQKMLAYPPGKSSKLAHAVQQLIQFISMAVYTQLWSYHELHGPVSMLIHKAVESASVDHKKTSASENQVWKSLAGEYAAMAKYLKGNAAAPLDKLIAMLESGDYRSYDPMMHDNLPTQLFSLYVQERKIQFARWPSPTNQEYINKVQVSEEFKAFLYACFHEHMVSTALMINLQDRLTWKEHSRSVALEELANRESFARHIEVATLPKDNEFYHQLAPYSQENQAEAFMNALKEQVGDASCGFLVPAPLKAELMKEFIPQVLQGIHRVFFSAKNVLTREQRLDFIELFYLFLELKMIEKVKPDIVGFTCKDGLDVSLSSAAEIFLLLKLINQERLSEMDKENLEVMIFGPCLMNRERLMLPDRFNRMTGTMKVIESARDQLGYKPFVQLIREVFGRLYKTDILGGKIIIQSNKDVF